MAPNPLFVIERDGDTLILTPQTDLSELEYAQPITTEIVHLLSDMTIKNLVMDFHKSDYFGSTALGFLIRLSKRIHERQGKMVLCNLSAHEVEILQVTKLQDFWARYPSREAALKAVKGQ